MPIAVPKKTCRGRCGLDRPITDFWRDVNSVDGRMNRCISCEQEARDERASRRAAGEDVPRFDQKEIERRREAAKELVAQGRLGGSRFGQMGGRPRRIDKINEGVLEYFRDEPNFQLIIRAYESSLRSSNKAARLSAAKAISGLELDVDEAKRRALGSAKRPEDMSPEELQEMLVRGVAAMIAAGDLPNLPTAITLPPGASRELA